jgi:acyl-homoserine-lactone acylase
VENSNDSYWLANPDHPFPRYSGILGPYDNAQLFRTRQGNQMVKARRAGTDGYGPRGFDIRSMERMLGAFSYYGGKLVAPQLATACEQHPSITLPSGSVIDVRAACPALRSYHGTGRLDDPRAWLFTTWLNDIPTGFPWRDAFDPAHPLSTPKVLDPSAPDTLNSLAEAVRELRSHHVPLNATLGKVVFTRQTGGKTVIAGCFGCFETINASHGTPADAAPYGQIIFGDSLLMFTELRKNGPRSQGTLTYSQATDPTSKWHSNLTRLYARGKFVPLRYTAIDLRSDRGARTRRLTASR